MSDLSHGLLLQEQGRLEEAEACFNGVLAREPDNDFVYGRLALCQMSQSGKKRRALDSINEAIRLRPDDSFYHSVRALVLSDLHRGTEALASADRAVSLNPEDSFALTAKSSAYCSMDLWSDAEIWSRKALAVDGDNAMAENLLAHTLRMQGKAELNAAAVARLLAADPEDSLAHVNAGWSALQLKDHRRAETHFREALRLDSESSLARDGLIESFKARSSFYRLYLSYCFFMQRFTAGRQWMIIIGIYLTYQVARNVLKAFSPALAGVLLVLWLGLVLWVWLAPGIGNFLILLDRSARLALKRPEAHQGLAVGGGLICGVVLLLVGTFLTLLPILLTGIGLVASTIPASIAFDNDSKTGRILFGGITLATYLAVVAVAVVESLRSPGEGIHVLTGVLGGFTLLACLGSTWLGNIRSLRRSSEG